MKKHSLSVEIIIFFVIFFLFIVSSFVSLYYSWQFGINSKLFTEWAFPWQQMILSAFCLVILLVFYEKSKKRTLVIFPVIMSFGLLFCASLFCKALSLLLESSGQNEMLTVQKPESFLQWIFCIFTFLFAAFNEEVIYRFYLADKMYQLLSLKIRWKILKVICEILTLLFFAFAHLYLGWISVLNAALAHIILRLCFLKNEKLWPCVASHFIYNIVSLILL